MAALFTDHAAVRKNRKGMKLLVDDAVGTARLFAGSLVSLL